MEPTDRKTAKSLNLNHYYTGQPCVNGHLSQRYVQSGACCACVRANVEASRAAYKTEKAEPREAARVDFRRRVDSIKVRVPLHVAESVRSIAAAMLAARFPLLSDDRRIIMAPELRPAKLAAGTGVIHLLAVAEDAPTLQAMARAELERFSADNLATAQAARDAQLGDTTP